MIMDNNSKDMHIEAGAVHLECFYIWQLGQNLALGGSCCRCTIIHWPFGPIGFVFDYLLPKPIDLG